jgi:hypothetical protein
MLLDSTVDMVMGTRRVGMSQYLLDHLDGCMTTNGPSAQCQWELHPPVGQLHHPAFGEPRWSARR